MLIEAKRYNNFPTVNKLFRLIQALLLFLPVAMSLFGLSVLQTSAAPLIQSYSTNKPLLTGTVVFIDAKTGYVEPASTDDNRKILGVIVGVTDSQPGLNNSVNKVLVARSGRVSIILSDVNGAIRVGDKISTSQIPGVSMKAAKGETIIGVAKEDYDGSKGQSSYEVTNDAGETKTANAATTRAELELTDYNGASDASSTNGSTGEGVASNDKNIISSTATILSVIAVLVLIVIMVIIVYTNVRSSFISIGRNPLEQKGIPKELNKTLFTALGFIAACIVIIYLIAKF